MRDRPHLQLVPEQVSRPDLRHARRRGVVVYRIRVDIDDARPAIWRRLDLRSNLTLDVLHQVLQVAFDWTDSHLHRFSIGGAAFAHDSQVFLGTYDEDDGLPAAETRLDETLAEPGDILNYLYDYGDNWELTLRLEEVLPAEKNCPAAIVVDGERAAPPEDCGHLVDAERLAQVVPDPALFEPERLNKNLADAHFVLREAGIDHRLVALVYRLTYSPAGGDLAQTALTLAGAKAIDAIDWEPQLRAHQWFLDRSEGGGIPLTAAGYLKPADVVEASKAVPAMDEWIGKSNREINCFPLLRFRESLQSTGLLRKNKGTLLLTKAGEAARRNNGKLVEHLASRLIPTSDDDFDLHATLLLLAYAAASPGLVVPFDKITALLAELGWRYPDGGVPDASALYRSTAWAVLKNVTDEPVTWKRGTVVSPAASALARKALGASD